MNNHDYAGAIMRNKRDIEDLAFEALHSAKKLPLE